MRVVHLIPSLFRPDGKIMGGAERYVLELARYMAAETDTTLVSFGEQTYPTRMGNLRVRIIGKGWRVRGQEFNPVSPAVLKYLFDADVVHCHQQHVLISTLSALFCRMSRRKIFVTDLGGGGWDISAYISTDRLFQGHLHISEYSRNIYGHQTRLWAHVISGGVDTGKFSPSAEAQSGGPVLFVGRLLPHKGLDDLIAAGPFPTGLEVIGQAHESKYFQHLNAIARDKGVRFICNCDDSELVAAYRRAACIVLPSVYKPIHGEQTKVPELLGQTLLEGMACGIPAICTDVASMPEIVRDGITGFIVPPNNPAALRSRVEWLLANPDEARRMGRAARQRVIDYFTWPAVVHRCLEIYDKAA